MISCFLVKSEWFGVILKWFLACTNFWQKSSFWISVKKFQISESLTIRILDFFLLGGMKFKKSFLSYCILNGNLWIKVFWKIWIFSRKSDNELMLNQVMKDIDICNGLFKSKEIVNKRWALSVNQFTRIRNHWKITNVT